MLSKFLLILSLMTFLLSPAVNKVELCFHGEEYTSDISVTKHDCCDTYTSCSCGCSHTHLSMPITLLKNSDSSHPIVINVDLQLNILSRVLLPELPPPLV
jgi:hypothetical protein